MVVQNEAFYLGQSLPKLRDAFEGFIAVDGGSQDGTLDILAKHRCNIVRRPWTNHHSDAQNAAFHFVKTKWVFFLDGDEAVFGSDIENLKKRLTKNMVFASMPRVNFADDTDHWDDGNFPDIQVRAVRMERNLHYRGVVHKVLYRGRDPQPVAAMGYPHLYDIDCLLYHYGGCKPTAGIQLKVHNYSLMEKGLPLLTTLPRRMLVDPFRHVSPFKGDHPLQGEPAYQTAHV